MNEHGKDGKRYHEDASFEGWVLVCLCGEPFMDEGQLEEHIEEKANEDPRSVPD
jgi:hypothetical protein